MRAREREGDSLPLENLKRDFPRVPVFSATRGHWKLRPIATRYETVQEEKEEEKEDDVLEWNLCSIAV